MFTVISRAPTGKRERVDFRTWWMTRTGRRYSVHLEACSARHPKVGGSVQQAGLPSFESVLPGVRRAYTL